MSWRYRKSINLGGGFRINLSKSGIGYSWGFKGFRVTKTAKGQTRKTYSMPGTGISYVETKTKNNGSTKIPIEDKNTLTIGETTYYNSKNLDEMSKNDIILKKINNIHILNYIANIMCILVIFLPIGLAIKIFIAIFGKINLEYEFDSYSEEKYNIINNIITEMKKNEKMWRVNTSVKNADIKYSSGATNSISRNIITIGKGTPWYIKSNIDIYYIVDGHKKIYLTPDRIIILNRFKALGCKYNNLDFNLFNSRYVEDGMVPKDAKIISYTWKYVNKSGGPDKRFKDNRQLPICDYGGLSVTSSDGINFRMQCSNLYIMAEVSNYLNKFVEIVNKEINSEDVYYNFEEETEKNTTNNTPINNKVKNRPQKLGKINKIISWIFFALFILAALGSLTAGFNFVELMIFVIIALICCPPVIEKVQEITKIKITTAMRILAIFVCIMISGFTTTSNYKSKADVNTQQTSENNQNQVNTVFVSNTDGKDFFKNILCENTQCEYKEPTRLKANDIIPYDTITYITGNDTYSFEVTTNTENEIANIQMFFYKYGTEDPTNYFMATTRLNYPNSDTAQLTSFITENIGKDEKIKIGDFTFHFFNGENDSCYILDIYTDEFAKINGN